MGPQQAPLWASTRGSVSAISFIMARPRPSPMRRRCLRQRSLPITRMRAPLLSRAQHRMLWSLCHRRHRRWCCRMWWSPRQLTLDHRADRPRLRTKIRSRQKRPWMASSTPSRLWRLWRRYFAACVDAHARRSKRTHALRVVIVSTNSVYRS